MKTLRLFGKVSIILLGVIGLTIGGTSCKKKDRTCKCTYTDLQSGMSYTINIDVKEKCWQLDRSIPGNYEVTCENK